jgi:hypothetical protein
MTEDENDPGIQKGIGVNQTNINQVEVINERNPWRSKKKMTKATEANSSHPTK